MHSFRIKDVKACKNVKVTSPTNPRYSTYYQEIFTAGDEDQFTQNVKLLSVVKSVNTPQSNIFAGNTLILPWEKYRDLTSRAVTNTFEYLFYKFKKGIFVQIRDNKPETFLPFSNASFKNNWAHLIKVSPEYPSIKDFLDYTSKLAGYIPNKIIPTNRWFANNALVRYEHQTREFANNLGALYDMYETLCEKREVPDIDFFLNRRDFPLITRDGTEPYNHLFGSKSIQMEKQYNSYVPIFSCSITPDRHSDILVPTYEDWLRVVYQETGEVIKYGCVEYPRIPQTPWEQKIKKAVFRGSSTGVGVTEETNKRLKALQIGTENKDILDVGITKWNTRPRKHETEVYLRTIERSTYPVIGKLSPLEQSRYAYVLNIEGHVAAYRLSYEMSFGSVILLVDSEWKMWFSRFIIPWKHYVPVKADLSDLVEKVQWCIQNDDECKQIAHNSIEFYNKYLSMDGVLDYLQKTFIDVARLTGKYTYLSDILSSQLMEEEEIISNTILNSLQWVRRNKQPSYRIQTHERNINSLEGILFAFHGSKNISIINKIFTSKKSIINVVQVGMETMVEKVALNKNSLQENIHESFIGLNVTNRLQLPNFAYVFGPKVMKPSQEDKLNFKNIYVEYVYGPTLQQWLNSTDFSFQRLLYILVQLNLALQVAQNDYGFIHYDLNPWNIVLVKLRTPQEFIYKVKQNFALKFNSDFIPVMIDFGKARAVVYDKKFEGIKDYGFVDLYKGTMVLDSLTVLISSLFIVQNRLSPDIMNKFRRFFELAGLKDCCENLLLYKKYGSLFGLEERGITPLKFINYIVSEFGQMNELKSAKLEKIPRVQSGNSLVYYFKTIYERDDIAIEQTLKRITLNTFPRSTTVVGKKYLEELTKRKTMWLDEFISTIRNQKIKDRWLYVKRLMLEGVDKKTEDIFDFKLPLPTKISLDKSTTPDEIEKQSTNLEPIKGDIVATLKSYEDMYLLNLYKDEIIESTKGIPLQFQYLSDIARMNTLIWLKNLM